MSGDLGRSKLKGKTGRERETCSHVLVAGEGGPAEWDPQGAALVPCRDRATLEGSLRAGNSVRWTVMCDNTVNLSNPELGCPERRERTNPICFLFSLQELHGRASSKSLSCGICFRLPYLL